MPRRGSFGRRRGTQSNMTTLIASLLREQRQAEDRAIFDAYQNGGLYKGKKVDDARILSYITSRRDGFGRSDPLYDEWNNRLIQTKFSIGEQKIGLAFKQGKVGAGAVAAFYRGQLSSLTRDSAFYREVAGRAAEWAKSAASAARGRARSAATKGMREKLNRQIQKQQDYFALEAALTAHAQRQGLISGSEKLTDADATELMDMFNRGIYIGEDQITLDSYRQATQEHFGALTSELQTRLQMGQQAVEAREKRSRFLDETVLRLNAVDERGQYEMARETWLEDVGAAQGNPWAVQQANARYMRYLQGIHNNAIKPTGTLANDAEFIGGLVNEFDAIANGKTNGDTVADLFGMNDAGGSGQDQAEGTLQLQQDLKDLASGKSYFGQTEPGGAMSVVAWPPGGIGLDNSLQPTITSVGGQRQVTYLKGQPVSASVIKDLEGRVIDPNLIDANTLRAGLNDGSLTLATGGEVGYVFTNPATGLRKYGVVDKASGEMLFTDENPWTSDPTDVAGAGLTVFGTATVNRNGEAVPDMDAAFNRPVSINTMDPLLSDSTVAPADLLALAKAGVKDFGNLDTAAYQARLQRQVDDQIRLTANRYRGQSQVSAYEGAEISDPRDVRTTMLEGMDAVRVATQQVFGSPDRVKDDAYVPPLSLPSLKPPTAPTTTGGPMATEAPSSGIAFGSGLDVGQQAQITFDVNRDRNPTPPVYSGRTVDPNPPSSGSSGGTGTGNKKPRLGGK